MIYLVDTSIWLDFLNKKREFDHVKKLQELLNGKKAAWCPIIQLELQQSRKERVSALGLLNDLLPSFEIDHHVWNLAYEIAKKCSGAGRPVPNSDILIYATAYHHNCEVFHNDKHFKWLAEIAPKKA